MQRAEPLFQQFRLEAARGFAQTMILIDDEASQTPIADHVKRLRLPRRMKSKEPASSESDRIVEPSKHALNAKTLIDHAMDLGLVCSVLRPKRGESIRKRVKAVAQCADIICLDWELYGDGGTLATAIIKEIVHDDLRRNGRLRLIAIYTGDTTNNKILEKVFDAFSEPFRIAHEFTRGSLLITSKTGLRIVCLFKTHGIQLADARKENQVSEDALPTRLQREFSLLAEGLLSTVALATIAAIRRSSHHVLGKFSGDMDGPYFHHRSTLPNVSDAEEYAVEIVLSELKNAIDKLGVAKHYAGPNAIRARIQELFHSEGEFALKYEEKNAPKAFKIGIDDVLKVVTEGLNAAHATISGEKPKKAHFERDTATIFSKDRGAAHRCMRNFAALTEVRSHPGSYIYKDRRRLPALGLGTVFSVPIRATSYVCRRLVTRCE